MYKSLPAIIAAMTLSALAGCSDTDVRRTKASPDAVPSSVQQLHKEIATVIPIASDDATEIIIVKKTVWNEASVPFTLGRDAAAITEGMRKYNLMPQSERIRFTLAVPFKDQYGNEKAEKVLAVTWLRSDLQKINFTNGPFQPQQMLNLYEKSWDIHPMTRRVIGGFCLGDLGKQADRFCGRESF